MYEVVGFHDWMLPGACWITDLV